MGRRLPNAIDVYVGRRIRLRRAMLEMSEDELAAALGVAAGEIRKYERGQERVSDILEVHFSFFFEDAPFSAGGGLSKVIKAGAGMSGASGFLSQIKRRRPIRRVVPGASRLSLSSR
jgi:transcriptional regulator with XRE-family HTH domain